MFLAGHFLVSSYLLDIFEGSHFFCMFCLVQMCDVLLVIANEVRGS